MNRQTKYTGRGSTERGLPPQKSTEPSTEMAVKGKEAPTTVRGHQPSTGNQQKIKRSDENQSRNMTSEQKDAQRGTQLLKQKKDEKTNQQNDNQKAMLDGWLDHIEMLLSSPQQPDFQLNASVHQSATKLQAVTLKIKSFALENKKLKDSVKAFVEDIEESCKGLKNTISLEHGIERQNEGSENLETFGVLANTLKGVVTKVEEKWKRLEEQNKQLRDECEQLQGDKSTQSKRSEMKESELQNEVKEYSKALQLIRDKCKDEQRDKSTPDKGIDKKKQVQQNVDVNETVKLAEETIECFKSKVSGLQQQLNEYEEAIDKINQVCKEDNREEVASNKSKAKQSTNDNGVKATDTVKLVEQALRNYSQRQSILDTQQQSDLILKLNKMHLLLKDEDDDTPATDRNKNKQPKQKATESSDSEESFQLLLGKITNLKDEYTKLRQEVRSCSCELEKMGQETANTSSKPSSRNNQQNRKYEDSLTVFVTQAKDRMKNTMERLQTKDEQLDGCKDSFKLIREMIENIAAKRQRNADTRNDEAEELDNLKAIAVNRVTDLAHKINELHGDLTNEKDENSKLQKQLGQAETSISDLKNRFSKYIGADLRAGNPNIADLSDSNRPTKIGENFNELYDNHWTDAFEELQKVKTFEDTQIIPSLLDILEFAFDYCNDAAIAQLLELEYHIYTPAAKMIEKSGRDKVTVDVITKEALTDFRKKAWVASSEHLIKNSKQIMKKEKKWNDVYRGDHCSRYICACIQLCWQMAVQSPPVHIYFEDKKKKKIKFDKEKYKAYMKSGEEMDFVVWPPLYLHEGGSLLSKGVAQAK